MALKQKVKGIIEKFCYHWFARTGRFIGNQKTYGFIVSPDYQKYTQLFKDYKYDIDKYILSATLDGIPNNQTNLIHRIIAHYHVLEKGLTMPEPRLGFGKNIAESLLKHLNLYINNKYDIENNQFQVAIDVFNKYTLFNKELSDFKDITTQVDAIYKTYKTDSFAVGGEIEISKKKYLENAQSNFKDLALSRSSIRNFEDIEVDVETIKQAVSIALKTPSVCNRQAWSTLTILNKELIEKVFKIQNGNRGFGHLIKCLMVVKMEMRAFYGSEERNQAFIDSGMYGMSLVYALQYMQLGSVVLNWATHHTQNKEIQNLLGLGDSETITMIIGVGHLKDSFKVPVSYRKSDEELNKFIF